MTNQYPCICVSPNYPISPNLLWLFLLCFSVAAMGQKSSPSTAIESFRKLSTTDQRCDFLTDSNMAKMNKPTYEAILTMIEEKKDDKAEFFWHYQYLRFAQHFSVDGREQIIKIIEEMIRIAEERGLEAELIVAQWHKSFIASGDKHLGEQDLYPAFLNSFEQIKRIGYNKFERYNLDATLKIIGCNFYVLGDFEKGLECLLEAEKISKANHHVNAHQLTMILNTIEAIYFETKNYPKAIVYAEKLYDFNLNYKYTGAQYWYGIYWQGLASLDIAQYKLDMGNFKESEKYAERGYELYKAQEDLKNVEKTVATFDALQVLMRIKLLLGKVEEVKPLLKDIEFLKSNIDFTQEVNYFKPLRLYDNYYKYYETKKDFPNAFRYLKLASEMKDSLNRRNDKRKLWQVESRVKADSYVSQIKLAKEDSRLQQKWRNIAIVVMFLVAISAFVIYRRIKGDKDLIFNQKALLERSLGEKETLLKEIHHRVKNNLQIISGLLEKQAMKTNDELTRKLLKEGQNRVFSMALVHQNLYQSDNFSSIEIKPYLEMLSKNIQHSHEAFQQRIQLTLQVDNSTVDIDTAIPLGLILNELITNCYKHAFLDRENGDILVSFSQKEDIFLLAVKDNGVGLPDGFDILKARSLGLNLVGGLVRQLNGKFAFQTNKFGTIFEIECKI